MEQYTETVEHIIEPEYRQLSDIDHVYMKADTYVGGDEKVLRDEWVYNFETGLMTKVAIELTPAIERCFMEILSNASDNVGRSRRTGVPSDRIEMVMNNKTISITNYGLPIAIELTENLDGKAMYKPELILGNLRSSSHYEVDRHDAGTNGYGAKAVNIFSHQFMVNVKDHIRHLEYTQYWNGNMKNSSLPDIIPYAGKFSSVQVTYNLDFTRFKYLEATSETEGGYPPEAFALFARHLIDVSHNARVSVSLNGVEYNFVDLKSYVKLYFGDVLENSIIHYQWPEGTELVQKKGYTIAKNLAISPEIELMAFDNPDNGGSNISFVNCIMTVDGGVHVNAATKALCDGLIKTINENILAKLSKSKGKKTLDNSQKRANSITMADVKPHISIFLSVRVVNPKFTSQTKTSLQAPVPKINIPENLLKDIGSWDLVARLYATLEAKQFKNSTKSDGKFRKHIKIEKGEDANLSGTKQSKECILCVTEGRSGMGYVKDFMTLSPGGRDFIGTLPLKGKSLNVTNANFFQIENNKELNLIKTMLGLCEGLDYTVYENYAKLRYGCFMMMVDADVDGKHIMGLLLNYFHIKFPSLLKIGFVVFYSTPILRVWSKTEKFKFYFDSQYEEWKLTHPDWQDKKKWEYKYFKGLGTSKTSDVVEDYADQHRIMCFYDDAAPQALKLAFHKDFANARKLWVSKWNDIVTRTHEIQMLPISKFINEDFILFSIADTARSLAGELDGLKESNRKIIFAAHKKWTIKKGGKYTEFKIGRFGNFVAENSGYHHGELILTDVIVNMAQRYIGANNIPWFTEDGQLGKRFDAGKDASAPRYTYTRPEELIPYIIRAEDNNLYEYTVDEGHQNEPKTYYPIIPMILVNGTLGIGTGFSSFIPCHDPIILIQWLQCKLTGNENLPFISPWYRGFTGDLKIIDRNRIRNKPAVKSHVPEQVVIEEVKDELLEDEEDLEPNIFEDNAGRQLLSMVSYGIFSINAKGTIIVTELPIGRSGASYFKWLMALKEEKKISDYRNLCANDKVYFEIEGFKGDDINHRTLKLQRTMGMSNMVVLDNGVPTRYDTSEEIMESFYEKRLPVYQRRKDDVINTLATKITKINHKIRFIEAVVSKRLIITGVKKVDVYKFLDNEPVPIPYEIYENTKSPNFSLEDIAKLQEKIKKNQAEIEIINAVSIQQLWLNDLNELETVYRKIYNEKKPTIKLIK